MIARFNFIQMSIASNSLTEFLSFNFAHYFFEYNQMIQYPDRFQFSYIILIYYKSCYGCIGNDLYDVMGIPFFLSLLREIPPFTVLPGNLSFFHLYQIYVICVLLLLLVCFRISVVQIHCIPCVLEIAFLHFRYRNAFKTHSRCLLLHIAYVCLYTHIHRCIFT